MLRNLVNNSIKLFGFIIFACGGALACTSGSGLDGGLGFQGLGPVGQAAPEMDVGVVAPIADRPLCSNFLDGQMHHVVDPSGTEADYHIEGTVYVYIPQESKATTLDGTEHIKIDSCAEKRAVAPGAVLRIVLEGNSGYLEKSLDDSETEADPPVGFLSANFVGPYPMGYEMYLAPDGYVSAQELAWLPCATGQESCVPGNDWQSVRFFPKPPEIKTLPSLGTESVEDRLEIRHPLQDLNKVQVQELNSLSNGLKNRATFPDSGESDDD